MKFLKFLPVILACFVLLVGLYIGIGGMGRVEYQLEYEELLARKPAVSDTIPILADGIPFKNILERKRWLKQQESEAFDKLFWGIEHVPDLIALLLTACAFSLVGTIINLLFLAYKARRILSYYSIVFGSLLGFTAGLFVIGLTYLIPTALVKAEDTQIRPLTLMFTGLFAGFCFMRFYNRIADYFTKITDKKT